MNNGDDKLKQQKAGNPVFIIVIFAALIAFLFYVPDIYKKYNSEINKFFGADGSKEEDDKSKGDDKSPISAFYQLGSKSTLKFNEITLTDISLSTNKMLTFTVNTDDMVNLDDLDYYVEFYRERTTFVGRRVLHGQVTKQRTFTIDVSNLPVDTTTYMTLSLIQDSDIQPIDSSSDANGLSLIKCNKDDETYEYEFYQKKLSRTTYKYTYKNDDLDELAEALLEIQKKERTYNEYTGINARITENSTSFIFLSEFDYEKVSTFSKIGDPRIFDKNTLNSVVKFKMDAEGFDCK